VFSLYVSGLDEDIPSRAPQDRAGAEGDRFKPGEPFVCMSRKKIVKVRDGVRAPASAANLAQALTSAANPAQAAILQRFFKTGPGQYGEGDLFIGLKVPVIRGLLRQLGPLPPREALALVRSPIHELRLAGLLLWVRAFEEGDAPTRRQVFRLYLQNTRHINNWDLVDLSAPNIVGGFLDPADTHTMTLLRERADSAWLWDRRIAVVATFAFIRQGRFEPTLDLCRRLLNDSHDLMHKACGWMLREVGKRNRLALRAFLDAHAPQMPRTMLRYALEHFDPAERAAYLRR
jgi:3-methyladenine DNA glycosylase AlkD